MKFYPRAIRTIARNVIKQLMADGDIEVELLNVGSAEEDLAAILREYSNTDEAVNRATREAIERRGLDPSEFGRIRRQMADARGFKTGENGIQFIIDQMIEALLISKSVEEVYAEDGAMKHKIDPIIRAAITADVELDRDVRARLKHLQEGTTAWDIEYRKVEEQLRRIKEMSV